MSQPVPPKHSPAKFSTYYSTHESRMDQFRANDFIREDTLEFIPSGASLLTIKGEISCRGDIVIRVEKNLQVIDDGTPDSLVQTVDYTYNASVRSGKAFLRYNNLHCLPGHPDAHHKNSFDWQTEEHLPGSPSWVGPDGWPTLSEFMEEVEQWYWKHKPELPNPESYAALDVRG